MKPIKIAFVFILLVLTGLWLAADTLFPEPFGYFPFRVVFMQYSGVLAIGLMSVAMLLALRPKRLEPFLDGLDKMYRLHKWLGIAELVVAVLHWWWATGSKCTAARACCVANASLPLGVIAIDLVQQLLFLVARD